MLTYYEYKFQRCRKCVISLYSFTCTSAVCYCSKGDIVRVYNVLVTLHFWASQAMVQRAHHETENANRSPHAGVRDV